MFHEKVAIVTGAVRGIGAAISEKLLREGFRLYLTDQNEERLKEFSKEMASCFGSERVMDKVLDVSSRESVQNAAEHLMEKWNRLDVVVNNAGVFSSAPLLELEEAEFEKVLNINLTGSFRVSQIFGRILATQRSGKIINIASIAALKGATSSAHYAASKGGLLALAKTMAVELAPLNIQVNTILPGYVDTEMMGKYGEQLRKLAAWRTPVKRLGLPQEVAEIVCFLATSESSFLTGSEIILDGGHMIS